MNYDFYKYNNDDFEEAFSNQFSLEYEFLECLGNGVFGQVFKCRNTVDNNIYAIK
jgi:hypothetical protein